MAAKKKTTVTNGEAINIAEHLKGLATHTKIDRDTMFRFLNEALKVKQVKEALELKRKQHKTESDKLRKAYESAKVAAESEGKPESEKAIAETEKNATEKAFTAAFRDYEDWLMDFATAESGIEFAKFAISKVPTSHADSEVEIEQGGAMKSVTYQWLIVQLITAGILTNDTNNVSPT